MPTATDAPNAPDHVPPARALIAVVAAGIFVTGFGWPGLIGRLPFSLLLKNQLHLPAERVADFWAIATFAWYVKPLAAGRAGEPAGLDDGARTPARDRPIPRDVGRDGAAVSRLPGARLPDPDPLLPAGRPQAGSPLHGLPAALERRWRHHRGRALR